MRVCLESKVDCELQSLTASVSAEIPDGSEELDEVLYTAMAEAVRLLAKAARENQTRQHAEVASA